MSKIYEALEQARKERKGVLNKRKYYIPEFIYKRLSAATGIPLPLKCKVFALGLPFWRWALAIGALR
jgi:hypothetical protein